MAGVRMAVEFRVLGSVEAGLDGAVIEVGPAQQRCVLVALLAEANQVVSADQLVGRVWGERVPHRARATLRTYLSRLRHTVGGAGEVEIGRRAGGYVLTVDSSAVDLHRFRTLVARARAAGEDDQALVLFEQALGLWRGEAFAGLDTPWINALRDTVEAERVAVELDHVDLRLRRGQHDALLAGLASRAALRPLDERVAGQLMITLYRNGRQADALAHYAEIRARLAEELGADPGPALRELHQQILTADSTLAAPAVVVPGSARSPVPRQLPPALGSFTGRGAEVERLLALCPGDVDRPATVVISAIDGMAGIGKTALALHAAHRLAPRFPDGQLFVDLHGYTQGIDPAEPADALDGMLRSLGTPGEQIPHTVEERAALWRTSVHDRRVLVVLDNALDETQVRPLLPGAPGCLVLVTSRRRLAGLDDASPISLDVLPIPDAVTLFSRAAGADRLGDQPTELVNEIVDLCGRLPLAIRLAAARLRHRPAWTLTHLVERLRDKQHRLTELQSGQRGVTAAVDLSYAQLEPERQRLYRLLGLHPGPDIDTYAAAALTDATVRTTARLLDDLLDVHLLQQHEPNRYRFHDLVRAHAANTCAELEPESDRHRALTRLFDHYAHAASVAMDVAYPDEANRRPRMPTPHTAMPVLAEESGAAAWLDAELTNLLAVAHHNRPEHTLHLSATLHRHLRTRGRYTNAETVQNHALRTAHRIGDRGGELNALNRLGHVHRMRERYGLAIDCFQRALGLAHETGDRGGEHDAQLGLGQVHRLQGRYEAAADCYRHSLTIARAIGHRIGELNALRGLGHAHRAQGRYGPATDCFRQSLTIARAIGHRNGELNALDGVGDVHCAQGRYGSAADCFQQSLAIARAIGHRVGELNALWSLGHTDRLQGRYESATNCYQQAMTFAREIGHRNGEFEALYGLGQADLATGQPGQALTRHRHALDLARELDQAHDQARAHAGMAGAHHALGQPEQARQHWQQASTILADLGLTAIQEVNADEIQARLAELDRVVRPTAAGSRAGLGGGRATGSGEVHSGRSAVGAADPATGTAGQGHHVRRLRVGHPGPGRPPLR